MLIYPEFLEPLWNEIGLSLWQNEGWRDKKMLNPLENLDSFIWGKSQKQSCSLFFGALHGNGNTYVSGWLYLKAMLVGQYFQPSSLTWISMTIKMRLSSMPLDLPGWSSQQGKEKKVHASAVN